MLQPPPPAVTRRATVGVAVGAAFVGLVVAGGAAAWWSLRHDPVAPDEGGHLVRPIARDRPAARGGSTATDGSTATNGSTATAQGPSVVLVIGCTLRKDILSPWGGDPALTPTLARLAAEGTVFEDALTAAPWTRPGHVSVLTGQHAAAIGMVEPSAGTNSRVLADPVQTLAEHFEAAGYDTLGVAGNPNINALFGFAQGFDAYYEASGLWRAAGTVKTPGHELVATALELVDTREGDGPFYLQLTLVDPHLPHDTSPSEGRALAPAGAPQAYGQLLGDTRTFDASIEALLEGLAERGHAGDDLVFVLVSDHGEGARWPDHHEVEHGYTLYESVLGMPWLIHGGPAAPGRRVGGLASQVDVLPTLTHLLGLPSADDYDGPGMDWSAQVRGELDRTTRQRAYADTWFLTVQRAAIYTETRTCTDRFAPERRNVGQVPMPACYDRVADPGHAAPLHPLTPDDRALLAELRRWRDDTENAMATWPHTRDAVIDQDLSDQLEALGYVATD